MKRLSSMIRVVSIIALVALFSLFASYAAAADFDGSKPLLCAITDIMECPQDGQCREVSIQDANIPRFLEIGFEKKEISEVGFAKEERRTEIKGMEKTETYLMLQGSQNNRGWSMTISQENGEAVISVAGARAGFVVFGACTPR